MLHFSITKKLAILLILFAGVYYALPNMLPEDMREKLPEFMSKDTVNLGLDLQGGSHMVIQVDVPAVNKRAYENLEDSIKRVFREGAGENENEGESGRIPYNNISVQDDHVVVELDGSTDKALVEKLLKDEIKDILVYNDDSAPNVYIIKYTDIYLFNLRNHAVEQTLEILRMRVDEFGVSEPAIQRQGDDRVIVELPGIEDSARAKSIIGRTAQLSFHLVDDSVNPYAYEKRRPPMGTILRYEEDVDSAGNKVRTPLILKKRASLGGENLSGASSGFTQQNESAVFISFDSKGTRQFADLTTKQVGKRMAIVLDGVVMSAPVLREPILGGTASITGSFTPKEAQDLAMVLRSGALPAPVKFAEERTIGPSLGQDSIEAGKTAVIVGFIGVMIMMLIFYQWFGLVANISLLFNVILIVGFMTLLGATMTMPGIAGIVLTIGMAVDANVLIFERIKEEYKLTKSPYRALETGFSSAYGTILDANITTLVAAIVLFTMGSGPIKGFALTLSVGIASSMFTAIMVTRLILSQWLHAKRPKTLNI